MLCNQTIKHFKIIFITYNFFLITKLMLSTENMENIESTEKN